MLPLDCTIKDGLSFSNDTGVIKLLVSTFLIKSLNLTNLESSGNTIFLPSFLSFNVARTFTIGDK